MKLIEFVKNFRTLYNQPDFSDYDYCEEDAYLDQLSEVPELLKAVPNGGRVPWRNIVALMPASERSKVVYEKGFETRGAAVLTPIGQMCHWTAGSPSVSRPFPSLSICINGRGQPSPVPGPLCNALIGYDGSIHIIASGRANHAGVGDKNLLTTLRDHKDLNGSPGRDSGGSGGLLIGYEIEFNGLGTFSPAEITSVTSMIRATAIHYGWKPEQTTIDHARWTRRKVDIRKRNPWPTPDIMRNAVKLTKPVRYILSVPNDDNLYRWHGDVTSNYSRVVKHIQTIPEVVGYLNQGYQQVLYTGPIVVKP